MKLYGFSPTLAAVYIETDHDHRCFVSDSFVHMAGYFARGVKNDLPMSRDTMAIALDNQSYQWTIGKLRQPAVVKLNGEQVLVSY